MQWSCGCCRQLNSVTIKGIDKTDGETVWEYGPGSFWRHHYGADAISGVVPNLSATLNKYAISAGAYPTYSNTGNRNTSTLAANVAEALSVTKLNSTDGSVTESAVLTGLFCDGVGDTFVSLAAGLSISNATALSGGDYVIVGERLPFIEFLAYTSNAATKDYILHAHGQQAGNVYLKTRTSSETITIPYDSDAAAVEALFEATADCVAATATGGPWPLSPIEIEVEWSASSGDISGISATATYSAEGPETIYSWGNVYNGGDDSYTMTLTVTSITVGATFAFQFDGTGPLDPSTTFTYVSTTEDPIAFITALEIAFEAYRAAHAAEANWGFVVLIDSVSNVFTVEYGSDARFLTIDATNISGITDARRAGSCAAAYDTGTGSMTSAVGYAFGMAPGKTATKMFSEAAAIPTITGLAVLGIRAIGSGPDNAIVAVPLVRNFGDITKASVVEKWDIASGEWTFDLARYCNSTLLMPDIIQCESGSVVCPIAYKDFDGDGPATAGIMAVADSAVTPVLSDQVSISATYNDNFSTSLLYDGDSASLLTFGYDVTFDNGNTRFNFDAFGSETDCDGTALLLGGTAFGADATQVYASAGGIGRFQYDRPTSFTVSGVAEQWSWGFYLTSGSRLGGTTQFRFVFRGANGTDAPTITTAWLDWDASASEIQTAILDQFGENTAGGGSNAQIWPFGEPDYIDNAYFSQVEKNLKILFRAANGPSAAIYGFIPAAYIGLGGNITIETQNTESFTDPAGIAAFSVTNASLIWSRPFGERGAATITQPEFSWLQGDFVYAYGSLVDAEL